MDFEPTPPRSPILLPMTLNIPGVTGRNYTILALKRIAQARIAAREEREESYRAPDIISERHAAIPIKVSPLRSQLPAAHSPQQAWDV